MPDNLVDTADLVRDLVDVIEHSRPQPPFIFIDLEGVNLSRNGSIAIMQVLVPPNKKVHLVDIHVLGAQAFETPGTGGMTLKAILESAQFSKVFFDPRNDSDALYSHFHISLDGVVDLQLLEFATRRVRGRFVKGLFKCISEADFLSWAESRQWREVKEAGQKLFAPEQGGRYEVFLERPLPSAMVEYCQQDVLYMPKLLLSYAARLSPHLAAQVQAETIRRIALSQSPSFNGQGKHMAVGPSFTYQSSTTTLSMLPFPIDVVCSPTLLEYCTLAEGAAIDPNNTSGENVPTVEPEAAEPVEPAQSSASAADANIPSVSEALGSMSLSQYGTYGKGRDVQDDDEDQQEWHPYEYSPGSEKDFTACGSDCGWCGHCDY